MYQQFKKPVIEHGLSLIIGSLGLVVSLSLVANQTMI